MTNWEDDMFIKTFAAAVVASIVATGGMAQDKTGWPSEMTIGTASQGGTYFVYGNGFAGYISEALGLNATGEVTGGPKSYSPRDRSAFLSALDQTIRNHAVDHYNGCVFSDICPIAELFLSQTVL